MGWAVAGFEPQDPNFEARVRSSFDRQGFMAFLGAKLTDIAPGRCSIELPARAELSQQHGFIHAGAVTTIADSAAGYAAYSLMPADSSVLTVEFKINLMAPARGERLLATAEVQRAGRTLSVVSADVVAFDQGVPKVCATMLATMFCLQGKPDGPQ